jgi:uncharacterized membrane protein YkgB
MYKLILISLLCVFCTATVLSQTNDQIIIKKGRYYVNDKQIKNKELKSLLKSEPESAAAFKKAKTFSTIGYIVMVPTIIVLVPTTGALPAALGGMLVATPFILISNKHMKKSIVIYNSKHGATGFRNELKLDVVLNQNDVGVSYNF